MKRGRSMGMMDRCTAGAFALAIALFSADARADAAAPLTTPEPADTYTAKCAACHGERRYGGYAPPLISETLGRKSDASLTQAILEGLPSTQMPAFAGQLTADEARSLVTWIRQPTKPIEWSVADIDSSRVSETSPRSAIPAAVSRDELILVVERGSGSVSVLDGHDMHELDRFAVGRVHGGIKFDQGLHRALVATRDGTLVDYDLDRGAVRTRVKVGVNTRNIAVSDDGMFVAVANQLPQGVVVLDRNLRPLATFPLPGQPSAIYQVPESQRFMVTLRDAAELYFVDYPAVKLERVELAEPFEDFILIPGTSKLVASSREGSQLTLYDYEHAQVISTLDAEGLPHLFSATFFDREGVLHAAFNHMTVPRLSIIDMDRFEVVKLLPLLGAGYFTRTHAGTPYLWIDSNTESIQLVDKRTLELVDRTLTPEMGKKAMHVEFTADGSKALLSIWHENGAVVVYDSTTLEELKRLPYAMPVGKYNTANKTRVHY